MAPSSTRRSSILNYRVAASSTPAAQLLGLLQVTAPVTKSPATPARAPPSAAATSPAPVAPTKTSSIDAITITVDGRMDIATGRVEYLARVS